MTRRNCRAGSLASRKCALWCRYACCTSCLVGLSISPRPRSRSHTVTAGKSAASVGSLNTPLWKHAELSAAERTVQARDLTLSMRCSFLLFLLAEGVGLPVLLRRRCQPTRAELPSLFSAANSVRSSSSSRLNRSRSLCFWLLRLPNSMSFSFVTHSGLSKKRVCMYS